MYNIEEEGNGGNKGFVVKVLVDGKLYYGSGQSKCKAKYSAAKNALVEHFKILTVPGMVNIIQLFTYIIKYIIVSARLKVQLPRMLL